MTGNESLKHPQYDGVYPQILHDRVAPFQSPLDLSY